MKCTSIILTLRTFVLVFVVVGTAIMSTAQVKVTTTKQPRPLIQKETGVNCNDLFFVQKGVLTGSSSSPIPENEEGEFKHFKRASANRTYGVSKPNSAPLQRGDILVGIDSARIRHYDSLGTYLGDLQMPMIGTSRNQVSGMMTDWDGNLYATIFQDNRVGKFSPDGTYLGYFDGSFYLHPESMVKDLSGTIYVGIADGAPARFVSYDESGNFQQSYYVQAENRGGDWIEISNNQRNMMYTSEGRKIYRNDFLLSTIDVFGTIPITDGNTVAAAFTVRELPTGGFLVVADSFSTAIQGFVCRFDANGNVIQMYDGPDSAYFFGMTLGLDGTTFWVGEYEKGFLYEYNISSGTLLDTIDVGANGYFGSTGGIFVYGEQGSFSSSTIGGAKYIDINQNGIKETDEPPLVGQYVILRKPDGSEITDRTDSLGIYRFDNLLPGNYIVRDSIPPGWFSTNQISDEYAVAISNNLVVGKQNFGEYSLANTLGGIAYKDQNANGILDAGELPYPNLEISAYTTIGQLNQVTMYTLLVTDSLGHFQIQGPPGFYTFYPDIPYDWSQTQPLDWESYEVYVETTGVTITNLDIGLAPPEYQNYYFTFSPDSLALSKDNHDKIGFAVKNKPDKVKFKVRMYNDQDSINGMYIEFINEINDSRNLSVNLHGKSTSGYRYTVLDSKRKKWYFSFGTARLFPGDSVTVSGIGNKGSLMKVPAFFWTKDSAKVGLNRKNAAYIQNILLLPMPNRLNIVDELFTQGGFDSSGGMIVGIQRKDSARAYGWVHMKRMTDVHKSLYELKRSVVNLHDSAGRGFDRFSNGKPFVGKLGTLPPSKQDNSLFANLVALKISILASAMEKTQLGLGELVYDDRGTNPLNGMMLKEIAKLADSTLTGKPARRFASSTTFRNLDTTLRQLVNAFDGIYDTISFGTKTVIYGDVQLLARPFLRVNPSVEPAKIFPRFLENEEPRGFVLFQNYPNPFNPTTTLSFAIGHSSFVNLKVYNMLGQEVAALLDKEEMDAGEHEVTFDAHGLSSGVYFYRLTAESVDENRVKNSFTDVKKLMLMR